MCWPETLAGRLFSGTGRAWLPGCRAGPAGFHGPRCSPSLRGAAPALSRSDGLQAGGCGTRSGMLSESVYGRSWHGARQAALEPELAATALARRPYDLRHAALSLWLNASGAPAEVAARAGDSARVLHDVYPQCIHSHDDLVSQRIEAPLTPAGGAPLGHNARQRAVIHTVGSAQDPVRYLSVDRAQSPRMAHARQVRPPRTTESICQILPVFPQFKRNYALLFVPHIPKAGYHPPQPTGCT